QVVGTERVLTVGSPDGPLRLVAPPARFGRTPIGVHRAPPRHGEHTETIRRELGLEPVSDTGEGRQ
ncbi:MAG TPA: CoA transferase, partial [Mycobacterium sp.]|nr:CoA transferase [Mycobacterium sp.]